jgi:hypothetical protein
MIIVRMALYPWLRLAHHASMPQAGILTKIRKGQKTPALLIV